MDCSEEVRCCLEVARSDAPEVLQAVEEAFDEVSVAIEFAIDGADDADVALTWDVSGGAGGFDCFGHGAAEVAAPAPRPAACSAEAGDRSPFLVGQIDANDQQGASMALIRCGRPLV